MGHISFLQPGQGEPLLRQQDRAPVINQPTWGSALSPPAPQGADSTPTLPGARQPGPPPIPPGRQDSPRPHGARHKTPHPLSFLPPPTPQATASSPWFQAGLRAFQPAAETTQDGVSTVPNNGHPTTATQQRSPLARPALTVHHRVAPSPLCSPDPPRSHPARYSRGWRRIPHNPPSTTPILTSTTSAQRPEVSAHFRIQVLTPPPKGTARAKGQKGKGGCRAFAVSAMSWRGLSPRCTANGGYAGSTGQSRPSRSIRAPSGRRSKVAWVGRPSPPPPPPRDAEARVGL